MNDEEFEKHYFGNLPFSIFKSDKPFSQWNKNNLIIEMLRKWDEANPMFKTNAEKLQSSIRVWHSHSKKQIPCHYNLFPKIVDMKLKLERHLTEQEIKMLLNTAKLEIKRRIEEKGI